MVALSDDFDIPSLTVLDGRSKLWKARREEWESFGICDSRGREQTVVGKKNLNMYLFKDESEDRVNDGISIFDPVLCEYMYKWFCPEGGSVIDPFAGGAVRGFVAHKMGLRYTGIDIRKEQVDSNIGITNPILGEGARPTWIVGDCLKVLDELWDERYDMAIACPPYFDLEVYSDIEGDFSNMTWKWFVVCFNELARKLYHVLNDGAFAVLIIGEIRGEGGYYRGFVPMAIKAFLGNGFKYMNEAVYCSQEGSAFMRQRYNMKTKKLTKTHQNVLVFHKRHGGIGHRSDCSYI